MRTTVTLDPDVERMLQTAVRERGVSFKEALNQAIRAGLSAGAKRGKRRFANLLLCAVHSGAPLHEREKRWLEDALSGGQTVAFS